MKGLKSLCQPTRPHKVLDASKLHVSTAVTGVHDVFHIKSHKLLSIASNQAYVVLPDDQRIPCGMLLHYTLQISPCPNSWRPAYSHKGR